MATSHCNMLGSAVVEIADTTSFEIRFRLVWNTPPCAPRILHNTQQQYTKKREVKSRTGHPSEAARQRALLSSLLRDSFVDAPNESASSRRIGRFLQK